MLTFKVSFISCRNGNIVTTEVEIPDAVPMASRKMAIVARLRANGYPDANDLVIHSKPVIMCAVECGGLPDNMDIVAAGY